MRWRSFRVRLTLWNAGVLALALTLFGMVLVYSMQVSMLQVIDTELADRAARYASGRPFRFRGFADGPRRGFRGDSPRAEANEESEPDLERLMALRRPRFVGPAGQSLRTGGEDAWDPAAARAAYAGERRYSIVRWEGERLRVLSVPLRRGNETVGVVQVARSLQEFDGQRRRQLALLLLLLPVALSVAVLGGWHQANRALHPVRRVTQAAEQISAEDLSQRLEVSGDDELARLARTFNGMIARLDAAFRGREEAYRRLEAAYEQQRRFTSDASHELRTPLTRIKTSTSMALSEERSAPEYRKALVIADRAANGMQRIIEDLLLLARSDAGRLALRLETRDMAEVVRYALAQLPEDAAGRITLDLPEEPLPVRADVPHLARVFVNLLENALHYTPAEGEIRLTAHRRDGLVRVTVSDTGCGIAPEHLPHLFERFYRVDAARNRREGGTGLGLAISKSLVEAHGGILTADSEPGRGATFTVSLPLV